MCGPSGRSECDSDDYFRRRVVLAMSSHMLSNNLNKEIPICLIYTLAYAFVCPRFCSCSLHHSHRNITLPSTPFFFLSSLVSLVLVIFFFVLFSRSRSFPLAYLVHIHFVTITVLLYLSKLSIFWLLNKLTNDFMMILLCSLLFDAL